MKNALAVDLSSMNDGGINILGYLEATAQRVPSRPALIMPDGTSISFAQLWERVCRISAGLERAGLRPGDRMVVMIPMSIDLYSVLLSIIKSGAVAVFVDPWMPMRKIAQFAAFAEPRGFAGVGRSHCLRLLAPGMRTLPLTLTTGRRLGPFPARLTISGLQETPPDPTIWQPESPASPALITFTSGSSGIPKGANRTHGFLAAQYAGLGREYQYEETDVDMPMFPVFALRNLADGITSVIPDMDFRRVGEVSGDRLLAQMSRHGVRTCTASPPFVDRLVHAVAGSGQNPGLRRILTGGAPVTNDQLERWRLGLPTTDIIVVYGSTEAEPVASIALEERLSVEGEGYCTGTPVEAVAAKVIRITRGPLSFSSWGALELPTGTIGELIVSGAHVCRDYFRNPAAVAENKLIDDQGVCWHRMGDTGYFDREGRFWLTGRVHSTILCKGEPLHAQLVESQVSALAPAAMRTAALEVEGRLVIVVQGEAVTGLAAQLQDAGIPVDRLIFTRKPLLLDPRHQSKIDYEKLRRSVQKSIGGGPRHE